MMWKLLVQQMGSMESPLASYEFFSFVTTIDLMNRKKKEKEKKKEKKAAKKEKN